MNYPSPRTPGSTPMHEWEYSRMSSATPTPSPRPNWYDGSTPRRPATRAAHHTRASSYAQHTPWTGYHMESPRYNSYGAYCTVDSASYYVDPAGARAAHYYDPPRPHAQARPPTAHGRRMSTTVPQRSSTVKPVSAPRPKPPTPTKATEADARRHKIPPGYSLKNWDAVEEPILLLGSVFDANSLGKWIYDWTVYHEGASAPIADMAGELWLLLIQLSDHIKQAELKVGIVRSADKRETIQDFIDGGERLMDKLRGLLKACEAPMLKAARKKQSSLGKNSGVEFVETLFGRDRELAKTEKFMAGVRLFNLRFEANCSEILDKPTA
ncbi:hypothetical protein CDD80_1113 [Ophiocordyceps camponoti-rufipedis]|uniref:Vegetative cell wall protein gp1 n=1 Tax=Ophiocordyceps camponoti-rufipedis TaxID=2004952 RepID=A0A2C5Y508_9HYPO|nr:hypothetical protein CDD80_1113 [Ophiocordyceps camponoti-rufipedis]